MDAIYIICVVMLFSGIAGGLVNSFLADQKDEQKLIWWQHILVGVVAAFMVPLFLNMISAGLISEIMGTQDKASDYSKLFVLAGFCLVAAVTSRTFIKSMSEKLLQEVRSANKKAEEATEKAAEAVAAVAPFVESDVTEADNMAKTVSLDSVITLTDDEKNILKSMNSSSYSLRSFSGIAKDTGLTKPIVQETISSLIMKGYVGQGVNTNGQPRWYLSPEGRKQVISDNASNG